MGRIKLTLLAHTETAGSRLDLIREQTPQSTGRRHPHLGSAHNGVIRWAEMV